MQFIALIYDVEGSEDVDWDTLMEQYGEFSAGLTDAGGMLGGEALEPISTATSIRVRNGKTEIIDGPFAETKEQLGGYYLLECANIDEALEYAAMIPTAEYGRIEVRPVMVFDN